MSVRLASPDRRIQRTRVALRDALLALMVQKDWDEISVQEICDRANVGRSTFYTHFDDKDALLLAGFEDLRRELRAHRTRATDDPFGFARGIIAHAHAHRDLFRALLGRRSAHLVQQRFRRVLMDVIEQDLAAHVDDRATLAPTVHFVVGGFFELLTWWIDARTAVTAAELERMFRRLARSALG